MSGADVEIRDNEARRRWEAWVDGQCAGILRYGRREGRVFLIHTEVDPAFEGRGIGSRLARAALDALRDAGTPGVAICPFVASYLDRHPEYADIVTRAEADSADR